VAKGLRAAASNSASHSDGISPECPPVWSFIFDDSMIVFSEGCNLTIRQNLCEVPLVGNRRISALWDF
jgi:hypothetical protein